MTFSFEAFRQILRTIREGGYCFGRLDAAATGARQFYVRHDIDISPACALSFGRIEAEEGVTANFYFQLNAETYNIFSAQTRSAIRSLRGMGHCVGLHVDEGLLGADPEKVLRSLHWFDACCEPIDMAVSFHRPSPAVLGKDFEGFSNGYGSGVWGPEQYLSDSRRSFEFYPRLLSWLQLGRSPIQLLLHPVWWFPHESADAIWNDLKDRRTQELADYMRANFSKVFSPLVPRSDRSYPI